MSGEEMPAPEFADLFFLAGYFRLCFYKVV